MDSNRNNLKNQKITMALFFIKDNNETQLFNKWTIFIGKRYLVGRKDSDINIDNPLISRRHLEITFYTFNQIKVKDLGSRNGTYINNGKATPNQEIKFTSKDKLSIGDINNKIVFLENQEIKNSVFNNPINENIDQKNSESTKIINTNNNNNNINKRRNQYNTSNNRYNRYINNRYRYRNRIRQRFIKRDNNYKQRAQSFRKSPIQKSKGRDIYTDYYFDSLSDDIDKTPLTNHNKSYSNKNLNKSYDRYLKKEIEEKKNELLGKKLERNRSKNDERKHLVKLFKNKKIGLEKLKKN
jgi:pSer/pThr/pTyr-binding forkhead associated (FHA) protein